MLKNYPVLRLVNRTGAAFEQVERDLKDLVDFRKNIWYMGHRLGEFRHYPENLNQVDRLDAYKETREMMDEGFRYFGLNALEFDIRVPNKAPPGEEPQEVYVVHDELAETLPPTCLAYLERNRLEHTIRHYIKKKYYETRFLGIELKVNKTVYDPEKGLWTSTHEYETRLARAGVAVIDRVCKEMKLTRAVARKVQASIGFSCFHLSALQAAQAAGGDRYRYYLIASTDRLWSGLANRLLWKNPPMRGGHLEKIAAAEWLTGIWFDPLFYDKPVTLFNDLNQRREKKLHFFVSTYYSGFPRLKSKLARERSLPPLPVQGLIFDLW